MTDPASARAWGWVAHLRDGGTTAWREWAGTAEPSGPVLPGAQQLELARRVNLAGRPTADLFERVLAADPPRRSRPALPLLDGPEVPAHGPRPVDPAEVQAVELLDLVAVVLARDLAGRRPPEPPAARPRRWARRYRLDGEPELARAVRRHLVAHGRPPSSRAGRLVVVGTDVGSMLVDLWVHRALGEGVASWGLWWRRTTDRDRLPGRVDLAQIVARGRATPGVVGVHLVTDPSRATRAAGLRGALPPPRPLAATAVELGRRVVDELRPTVAPETRGAMVSELLRPRLATVDGPPPVVPARHRRWVEARATRLVAGLTRDRERDRYPVSGSLELLLPGDRPGVEVIGPRETLTTGIALLLAADGHTPEEAW
ncbi:hypothetical protein [Nocardioides sp. GXQ0305]|uniref:hypothetical protein n=1 Tax=Nocardioides sp. GXQ0305 TaxID=3423912 RepID=UPI003D7D5115